MHAGDCSRGRSLPVILALLVGCASSPHADVARPGETPEQTEARLQAEAIEREKAERKAKEQALLDLVADANLVAMPDVARARIRATSMGDVAQLRFAGGDVEGAIDAVELGLEAAASTGDPRITAALRRTQYLILRFSALEAAKNGDFNRSLQIFDRLSIQPGLRPDERAQVAGDRLMVIEMGGDGDARARDAALAAALRRILGPDERAQDDRHVIAARSFDLDAERIRAALSAEIGREVAQARLPSTRDAPQMETGAMDQAVVVRVVSQNKKAISTCYTSSLRGGGGQRGKLEVRLTVQPTGAVGSVQIATEQFKSSQLGRCIVEVVSRWRFPPFDGPAREVELPFVLDYFH
ncbi:MAG: AgmX/PglI C-terminal domain-containing protein [Deltaproteobacteria bacterium]|nr:AgmX/PglI C-terminal domain-containing protein [Deltaproteobacteria bacterium]